MADRKAAPAQVAPLLGRRHFMFGAALAAASAVAFARQPTAREPAVPAKRFESWVPNRAGNWSAVGSSGVVLPPPDELSERLYDNLVTRVYADRTGDQVMLLMAYNNRQDGMLQVHRPEVCYPVGGFLLTPTEPTEVPVLDRAIPANVFTARGAGRTEQVLYFTRLGSAYPRSWAEQRVTVIEENLAGRVPDGMLLRVSILDPDRVRSLSTLRAFIQQFAAASPPSLRRLMLA